MQDLTDISLQKGEEIIWKGKAQLPSQRVHEYIPMLILILVYANSLHLLYPVEPLPMLHELCSGNLAGGILLTGIVLFAAAPTLKRKILANQTYIFTNRRAVALSASGCVLHSIPAEQISECIIKEHSRNLVSMLMIEKSHHETSTTLLFAHIPADILKYYHRSTPPCTPFNNFSSV